MKKITTLLFLIVFSAYAMAESKNASVCDGAFIHSTTINPDSIVFTHTGASVGYYSWTFGDGDTSNLMDPTHVYSSAGTYTVCLHVRTVPANDTCYFCDTVVISPCNATFSHYNIGNPDSVHFYYGATGATGQVWSFGDTTYSTQQYPWHVFPGPGTYNVCLTLFYPTDTCAWCDTVVVPSPNPCNATFGHYSNPNNPDSIHFYANTNGASIYYWTFSDTTTATGQYPWHEFPGPGTYSACLTAVFSGDTCTWCDTVIIPASPPCNATFGHYSNPNNPDSIHFYANTNGASIYYWTFSDSTTTTGQYPWHEFTGPGTYTACLTAVFSGDTCTWCDTVIIGNSYCNTHFAYYSLSNPDSVHFYPTGNAANSYYWDFGDGNTSTMQYPWHEYSAPGTYYVCLTAYYPADTCMWCDSITIDTTTCQAEFSYYIVGDSVHFYPLSANALSYTWEFGDGDSITATYPWHQYDTTNVYYVCLTADYSTTACTWCDTITVSAANVYYRMANNSSLDQFSFFVTATSVSSESVAPNFSIYPNPAHSSFTISLIREQGVKNEELKIADVIGRIIYQDTIQSLLSTFSLQLTPGMYFIQIKSVDGRRVTKRIIIE